MNRSVTWSGNLVWQQCGPTSWPTRTAHDVKPRAQSWTRSRCSLKGLCASSPRRHRAATSGPLRCQMSGSSSSNVWTWKKHRRCRRPDPCARPCRISFKYPQLSRHKRTMLKPGKCCDSQASRWPRTPVAWRTAVVCATFSFGSVSKPAKSGLKDLLCCGRSRKSPPAIRYPCDTARVFGFRPSSR